MCTIQVYAETFTDLQGVYNIASSVFEWTSDRTSPTMTISSSTVNFGTITNDNCIDLIFSSSEPTNNFSPAVNILGNGAGGLSNITSSNNNTVFNAKFCPNGDGLYTFTVNSGSFTDEYGNANLQSNTFKWIYDASQPLIQIISPEYLEKVNNTVVIYSTNEDLSSGSIIYENITNLTENKYNCPLPVNKLTSGTHTFDCSLDLTDGNQYTITFSGVDLANNVNTASQTINFDKDIPQFSNIIPSSNSRFNIKDIEYTLSKDLSTGSISYINVFNTNDNGTENLIGLNSGNQVFSGLGLSDGHTYNITLNGVDSAGNSNSETVTAVTYDVTKPTITILSNDVTDNGHTNKQIIDLTFTLSEAPKEFKNSNISADNGHIINLSNNGLVYTAQFSSNSDGTNIVSVNADTFKDLCNDNALSDVFSWTYDTQKPIVEITYPLDGSFVNALSYNIIYKTNEDLSSGRDIIYRISGQPDANSPHVVNLSGTYLESGTSSIDSTIKPELINGTAYLITIDGIDLAGNQSDPDNVLNVTYDITPQVCLIPSDNSFVNSQDITFDLTKILIVVQLFSNQ